MKPGEKDTLMERLSELFPRSYRQAVSGFVREVVARFPPVAIERRIDAFDRHLERRLKDVEAKLDELLRRDRDRSRAA